MMFLYLRSCPLSPHGRPQHGSIDSKVQLTLRFLSRRARLLSQQIPGPTAFQAKCWPCDSFSHSHCTFRAMTPPGQLPSTGIRQQDKLSSATFSSLFLYFSGYEHPLCTQPSVKGTCKPGGRGKRLTGVQGLWTPCFGKTA